MTPAQLDFHSMTSQVTQEQIDLQNQLEMHTADLFTNTLSNDSPVLFLDTKETSEDPIPDQMEHQNISSKNKTPSVTAACPYPALRLDKLYAALIRCLVLWTVTKQFLVFLFKGLYLLTGGSDVTRGISCDSALH